MNFGSGGVGQVNFYGNQNDQIPKLSFLPNQIPFLPNKMPFLPNLNPNNAQLPILPETPKINAKNEEVKSK